MKKICALFLALVMLVTVQTAAMAEKGYELLKELVETNGTGISVPVEEESYTTLGNLVVVGFEFYSNSVLLIGRNSAGTPEGTVWTIESTGTMLGMLAAYCSSWDILSGWLEDGYSLMITVQINEDDDLLRITTAEEAQELHDIIMN